MRKTVLLLTLLVASVYGRLCVISAQAPGEVPPLTAIDFSAAEISQSGPDAFYIRNVGLPDGAVSIELALDGAGAWQITGVFPEDQNLIPQDVVLEFATLTSLGEERIEVDGIIFAGRILSGVLDLSASGITSFDQLTRRGTLSEREFDYPQTLRDLLLGRRIDEHQDEVAQIRSEYERRLSDLQDRYQAVVAEREALQSRNADLAVQVENLRRENDALRVQVSELESQLAAIAAGDGAAAPASREYLDELSALRREIAALRAEIAELQAIVGGARGTTAPTLPAVPGAASAPKAADGAAADGAAADGAAEAPLPRRGEPRVGEVGPEGGLGVPREDRAEPPLPRRAGPGEVSLVPADERPPELEEGASGVTAGVSATEVELRRRIEVLEARNADLVRTRAQLEEEIRSTLLADGYIAVLGPSLDVSLLTGFETATAQLGAWQVVGNRAIQRDPEMLFAKLALPVEQTGRPVLYSFEARSTDPEDEWVGFGIHIYVDDVEKKGYGLGRSLLVWLTRDPEVYKTRYTYLQLYRSDDDVNMGRVMDAAVPDPIAELVSVDVLYEPVRQYITVAIDGVEKIRYKTWFGIDDGVQIALRSLGTAEFRNLSVRTRAVR